VFNSKEDLSLPLFLYFDETIVTYVIGNRIVGCTDEIPFEEQNPFNSFEILNMLFSSDDLKQHLPFQLYHYFNNNIHAENSLSSRCLIGEDYSLIYGKGSGNSVLCLRLDAKIIKNQATKVLLYNITCDGKPLERDVELSSEDAFLIFSNLCTNVFRSGYYRDMKQSKQEVFDSSIVKQIKHDSPIKTINNFCVAYLDYLKKSLNEGTILPIDILRTGGIGVLHLFEELHPVKNFMLTMLDELKHFQTLPINLTIVYYTLLKSFYTDSSIYHVINEFYEKKRKLVRLLREEVVKPFPTLEY